MNTLQCRVCGHGEAESMGSIPDCREFAGQQVSPPIKGGGLWICRNCGSMFRYPTLSSSDYISLYEKATDTVWPGSEVERNDIEIISSILKHHVGGSILDVGCYTGHFLSSLPEKFIKFGVEPSTLASRCAASKRISLLGNTLAELETNLFFDVVVSIDVVEHVLDVEKFLDQALARVKENGLLIISTGNPSCFFWKKVFKSKFWYCFFPEHVTFPSYKYFKAFSQRHGLPDPEQIRLKYMKLKSMTRLSILLHYVAFSFSPALYQALINIRSATRGGTSTVSSVVSVIPAGVFTDHHVIIFRKGLHQ